MGMGAVRVLIVDDSAVVRQTLTRELSKDPEIQVVGAAPDPFVARDMILSLKPDVLSMDVEMPRMDGITFLRKLMHYYPIPVVIVSSLTPRGSELSLEALSAGAVGVISKQGESFSFDGVTRELAELLKTAAHVDMKRLLERSGSAGSTGGAAPLTKTTHRILAIGSSTGGTVALERLLKGMPVNLPGTIISQHIPQAFVASFAKRLSDETGIDVAQAQDGESLVPGKVRIAPGNRHLLLRRSGTRYLLNVKDGPLVNRHRPSVDVMFKSVAMTAGKNAIGVILTGMGKDGARGLRMMRESGAPTMAQDEASCVVFGMPRAAIEIGAANEIMSLDGIAPRLISLCQEDS